MSLIISDLHGNYPKLKAFADYKPEEEHIILGDFFDSWNASDEDIAETFRLAIKSKCVLIAGNHELQYLPNAHGYFECSGHRTNPIFKHLMASFVNDFHAALVRDNYLLTHGGLSKWHGRYFDSVKEAAFHIEEDWQWYINNPVVPESLSWIFNIGSARGGRDPVGGPFWCSIGYEKLDPRFNQCVGHTPKEKPKKIAVGKKDVRKYHIAIDSPKFVCFNTKTESFENFMPKEYRKNKDMCSMLERKF